MPCILVKGNKVLVTPDEVEGTPQKFQINFPDLLSKISIGSLIVLDNGGIQIQVLEKSNRNLVCSIILGGNLPSHSICHFPEQNIDFLLGSPNFCEKDINDLSFICELKPDFIGVSYVSSSEDIHKVRGILLNSNLSHVKILARLENQKSIQNIQEIVKAADGILIVRSQLGLEFESWKVPEIQKMVIQLCRNEGKPVLIDGQVNFFSK